MAGGDVVGMVVLVGWVRRGGQLAVPPVIHGRLRVEVVGCTKRVARGCKVELVWVVMMNCLLLMMLLMLMLLMLLMLMRMLMRMLMLLLLLLLLLLL
jgi:hypothetical protein